MESPNSGSGATGLRILQEDTFLAETISLATPRICGIQDHSGATGSTNLQENTFLAETMSLATSRNCRIQDHAGATGSRNAQEDTLPAETIYFNSRNREFRIRITQDLEQQDRGIHKKTHSRLRQWLSSLQGIAESRSSRMDKITRAGFFY